MVRELFATSTCPYCAELRERLELDGLDYLEYDVDRDFNARARLTELVGRNAIVPVLVEGGKVTQIGVSGRGCYVNNA